MAGRSDNKIAGEGIFRGRNGWESDLALDTGASSAFKAWCGVEPVQVADAPGVVGTRKGTEAGRGPVLADMARPNMHRGGFAFLAVKGCDPWPSKSVITTGKGIDALRNVVDLGLACPTAFLAFFPSGRVGVLAVDLAALVREHGIAPFNPDGYGKGKAPPFYIAQTSRPSGVKSAAALVRAGAMTAEQAEAASTKVYDRVECSLSALGFSRGRGWTEIASFDGEPNVEKILAHVENALPWESMIFDPADVMIG